MKRKIVGVIRPFDKQQKIFVYEDNNLIDATQTTINDMNDTLFELSEKYNTKEIDLSGPKQYNRGLAKKIQKAELEKYSTNTLQVNVM